VRGEGEGREQKKKKEEGEGNEGEERRREKKGKRRGTKHITQGGCLPIQESAKGGRKHGKWGHKKVGGVPCFRDRPKMIYKPGGGEESFEL